MKKKIICLITCFMLVIGSLFALIPLGTAKADNYTYTGEVSSDNSSIPDYAITSIESFTYDTHFKISLTYQFTDIVYLLRFRTSSSMSSGSNVFYGLTSVVLNFDKNSDMWLFGSHLNNCDSISITANSGILVGYIYNVNGWGVHTSASANVTIEYNFTFTHFSPTEVNGFVDMVSNFDNYGCGYSFENTGILSQFMNYYYNGISMVDTDYFSCDLSSLKIGSNTHTSTSSFFPRQMSILNHSSKVQSKTLAFSVSNLKFNIYRPTDRINNTLVIYNYNYGYLSGVTSINYTLRKNNDYYNVSVSGDSGFIPNSYFIYVSSSEINNRVFDEYITLKFPNSYTIVSDDYSFNYLTYDSENLNVLFNFGFDFNFTYYTEPFIASNGSFNFDFDKPSYVKMEFSLYPFYIPLLEFVQNAFIFLVFYCPVISDILSLLQLDLFIGGLISILNYLLGLEIGQFITSCIAFVIFFAILKSFMPVVFRSGVVSFKESQFYYNMSQKKNKRLNRLNNKRSKIYSNKVMLKGSKKFKKKKKMFEDAYIYTESAKGHLHGNYKNKGHKK